MGCHEGVYESGNRHLDACQCHGGPPLINPNGGQRRQEAKANLGWLNSGRSWRDVTADHSGEGPEISGVNYESSYFAAMSEMGAHRFRKAGMKIEPRLMDVRQCSVAERKRRHLGKADGMYGSSSSTVCSVPTQRPMPRSMATAKQSLRGSPPTGCVKRFWIQQSWSGKPTEEAVIIVCVFVSSKRFVNPGRVRAGRCGTTTTRPGLQALVADARAGRPDPVLAEALDRIGRDQEHTVGIWKTLVR